MRALSTDECRQRGLAGHESHLCAENGPGNGLCFVSQCITYQWKHIEDM